MNFREKVKAIVSEAGVKKLTRQLHSRPRNIPKAVDRLNQRDYRRTSGKARSGDRKATKQLAQMHQQSTTQPVLAPKKSKRDRDVGLSEAGIKKLTRQLKARPVVPAKDFQAVLGKEAQLKYKKADSAARKAKKREAGISEDSDAIKWLQAYDDKRKQRARHAEAGAELRRQNAELRRKKKSKPQTQTQPQHEETGRVVENSDHPFYQKVKSLSRGKKNHSLLEKKSKTIKLLIGKIKPCGEKSNVAETYTRKWQPGDEPKQTGREPATTPASDKAFKKRQKKFLAGIKKTKKKK